MPSASSSPSQAQLFAALSRTYATLSHQVSELLKPLGLSLPKYWVLQIVREGGGKLPAGAIARALVWPSSDVTRLLDGLEEAGLVNRERDSADRRVIWIQLTTTATRLMRSVDHQLGALQQQQYRPLTKAEQDLLNKLLTRLTPPPAAPANQTGKAKKR